MATKTESPVQHAESRPSEDVYLIDLHNIVANTAQSRGMGVLPTLQAMGYGLFERLPDHDDKEPIWTKLMSHLPTERKEAVALLQENEGHIVNLAESMEGGKQLQNIVVVQVDGDKYDVVGGMRRAIAMAYNHAIDVKATCMVEAKVLTGKFKPIDLLFLALDENCNREEESPIDKAITYKKLKDEYGLKPDDIGKRQGLTGQSVRNHIKLLDPKLSDKLLAIHNREMTIDAALKRLTKLKEGESGESDSEKENGKRARMHSVKKLVAAYRAKKKPEWMEQKEWELFIKDDVRRWVARSLQLKFTEFSGEVLSEEPEEEEKAPKAKATPKKKAKAASNGQGEYKVKIPRSIAVKLLKALGKEEATDWDDGILKEKLQSIVNLADDTTALESKSLQDLLTKLLTNYSRGINVTIS